MELILDKNKKREHLYLEVFHYYRAGTGKPDLSGEETL